MSGYLLDTNCLSELVRLKPERRVTAWIEAVDESLLHLSVLTFGEIRKGLAALPQSKRRTNLETWVEVELRARFFGRILPVDIAVADRWGLLAAQTKAKGKPLSIIDGLLAATSLHYNLTLVTRNTKDVIATGVATLDPWDS
jgi:predicted nucleic acid-binding protein